MFSAEIKLKAGKRASCNIEWIVWVEKLTEPAVKALLNMIPMNLLVMPCGVQDGLIDREKLQAAPNLHIIQSCCLEFPSETN